MVGTKERLTLQDLLCVIFEQVPSNAVWRLEPRLAKLPFGLPAAPGMDEGIEKSVGWFMLEINIKTMNIDRDAYVENCDLWIQSELGKVNMIADEIP